MSCQVSPLSQTWYPKYQRRSGLCYLLPTSLYLQPHCHNSLTAFWVWTFLLRSVREITNEFRTFITSWEETASCHNFSVCTFLDVISKWNPKSSVRWAHHSIAPVFENKADCAHKNKFAQKGIQVTSYRDLLYLSQAMCN